MRVLFLTILALVAALPAMAQTSRWAEVPTSQAQINLTFAPLVKEAAPAVVNIYARRVVAERQPRMFADDPFFGSLLREFGQPRQRMQNSLGSGVILSADGIVVSNYHVVGMATDIRVVLNDRREFTARVLLGDEESDLAVLQLEGATDLPYIDLRNSDTVEVGELVLAIGNPFGIGQTVSSGIVSGLARSGAATGNARGYFIQTDAAINPGNSGGALIDVNGDLIGINTSILTRSGGSNGIGFAIPSLLVSQFVEQARAEVSRFQRPWAGVTGQPVSPDMAEAFGLVLPEGVILSDLHPASPFSAAGFVPGDVIRLVDGQPVNTPAEMIFRMTVAGIGHAATISATREGQDFEVVVRMIEPPEDPPRNQIVLREDEVLPGLTLARTNPAVLAELDLSIGVEAVVVVDAGPVAPRIGLRRGDAILSINRFRIESPLDVRRALLSAGRRVTLDVMRGGRRVSLAFRL
ncbi:trypsin-like peptidase domain-containing protein [Pseudaestuariivita atlantica]|uniref:Serine protease n=1 Tax=Pseudaestuariivita atlantica TaxID=1317121 RepID=A0A0L1JKK4_9RHOB|nr:trypsin-like peptidase domain-containing protein [Pseudaestuariivita atlantica]KNG92285.1 serine protease [Pseudaestuariivita atlantica]